MLKAKRILLSAGLILLIGFISNWLVLNTKILTYSIFDTASLFTYFGVLIGFALTIYTFGLSMVNDIKSRIEKLEKLTEKQKDELYSKLVRGFSEIKQDIWLIFYSLIIMIAVSITKGIQNPFDWNISEYKLPETINITLFITTTIAMYDIMKTLFNLAEINLELIKNNKAST
jgi:hypothetical protein